MRVGIVRRRKGDKIVVRGPFKERASPGGGPPISNNGGGAHIAESREVKTGGAEKTSVSRPGRFTEEMLKCGTPLPGKKK